MAKEMTHLERINAYCFALIGYCRETNAESMTLKQEGVTHLGEPLGNWEVRVQKEGAATEDDVKNLYYLDEMIKDMLKLDSFGRGEKYTTFIHDWYDELYKKVGHTDEERAAYLEEHFGDMDEGWVEENFMSVEERNKFLKYDL